MLYDADFCGEWSYVFHPISLFSIGINIVYHTVRLFSPDTLVFRRVRKTSSKYQTHLRAETGSQYSGYNDSDVSQTSSRVSRRLRTAATVSTSVEDKKQRAHSADVVGSAITRPMIRRSRSDDHRAISGSLTRSASGRVTVDSALPATNRTPLEGSVTGDATPMVGKPPLADGSQLHHRSRRSSVHTQRSRVKSEKKDYPASLRMSDAVTSRRSFNERIRGWFRISQRKVTKAAELFVHVYHSLPVATLHYFCVFQWQISAVPLLCFPDISLRGQELLQQFIPCDIAPSGNATATQPTPSKRMGFFNSSPVSSPPVSSRPCDFYVASSQDIFFSVPFMTVREILRLTGTYLVDILFMDNTIVVRQLRSRHYVKRALGWVLRIVAHTLVDSVMISTISTMLCLTVQSGASHGGPLRFTMPGLLKGMSWSVLMVIVDRFVSPVLSHLVNRAMVTLFEAVEYFIQRRYVYVDSGILFSDSSSERASYAGDHDYSESEGSEMLSKKSSRITPSLSTNQPKDEPMDEDAVRAARIREQERIYERERRERHRLRRERIAAQETSVQRTIVRAILYRLVSLLVAQIVVEHPVNVLLEVMRGRSVMHLTGLLREYNANSSDSFPISWSGFTALMEDTVNRNTSVPAPVAVLRAIGMSVGEEVNIVCRRVVAVSGQLEHIRAITQRVAESNVSSAFDSIELAWHTILSLSSLYRGVGVTILDNLLSFYVGTWRRLAG